MIYRLTIKGFDSGLNEVLNGVYYDYKSKRVRNPVKANNDKICITAIRIAPELKGVWFDKPIVIHYKHFCKDKRHDRSNIASAVMKSFEDGLQKAHVLKNDGWDDVVGFTHEFFIDKVNPRIEVEIEEVER